MQNSNIFSQKIDCIYKNIANGDLTFLAKLFLPPEKQSQAYVTNRKAHISRKWLRQSNSGFTPRTFKTEYKDYIFFKEIQIDNKPLFKDAYEFLNLSLKDFCKKIYMYVNYKNNLYINNKSFVFNYLYIHDLTNNNNETNYIQEYQIVYNKKISATQSEVTVYSLEKSKDAIYKGIATNKNNKLILQLENNWNYVTIICNLEFFTSHTIYLIGIASLFSTQNEKVPKAQKVILTRNRDFDYNRQYLTLNETENLYAEENSYKFNLSNYNYINNHFNKYASKINAINSFFKNVSQIGYFAESYYQLAFKEFQSSNAIFNCVKQNSSYYVKNRFNILKAVFNSFNYEKFNNFYMVIPFYENSLFNNLSDEIEYIINAFKYLKEHNVNIEIIFIIDNCQNRFTLEFKNHLEVLRHIANIYFLQKEEIKDKADSLDFLFTSKDNNTNYIIYKPLNSFQQIFIYSKETHAVKQFTSAYKKFKLYAKELILPLKIEDYCTYHTDNFKTLIGEWYFYIYGSQQLWQLKVKIYNNSFVEIYYKDRLSDTGKIINNPYQSIIIAKDINSKITTVYMFDNNLQELNHAFLVKCIAKKYKTNTDMFTVGICSQDPIKPDDIMHILGNPKEQTIFIDNAIKARLSNYIYKTYERN